MFLSVTLPDGRLLVVPGDNDNDVISVLAEEFGLDLTSVEYCEDEGSYESNLGELIIMYHDEAITLTLAKES